MLRKILTFGRQPNITDEDRDEALRKSIADKVANYIEPVDDTADLVVIEGQPCAIEMSRSLYFSDLVASEWHNKETFPDFAQEVCLNDITLGNRKVRMSAYMIEELAFLRELCLTQLALPVIPRRRTPVKDIWANSPDAKSFNKQEI